MSKPSFRDPEERVCLKCRRVFDPERSKECPHCNRINVLIESAKSVDIDELMGYDSE